VAVCVSFGCEVVRSAKGNAGTGEGRHWKAEFAGMLGTVQHCWGQSEHAAVDVLLEDRRSELFWLTDLKIADEAIAI
jgi:hypothetical protein